MNPLLLIISLLFRLITSSSLKYRVGPDKSLMIDHPKFKAGSARPRSVIYVTDEPKDYRFIKYMDTDNLREFYSMAETGVIVSSDKFDINHNEIFESNIFHAYTPAEWAVYNDKTEVLRAFIQNSLIVAYPQKRINAISTNLLALAIQRNNLKALKLIIIYTGMQVNGNGSLSIAAQHHASHDILNFLLNDCNLRSEINQTDIMNFYLKPLHACIKFNNFNAAIMFLNHGAVLSDLNKNESPLASIMISKKKRILESILKSVPELCEFRDADDDSLLHYAATFAYDPEFISIILRLCPTLSVNSTNNSDFTALDTVFEYFSTKDEMAKALITGGADIFHVPRDRECPLEIIMRKGYENLFAFILESYLQIPSSMKRIVEFIVEFKSWSWLDRVIEVYPDIPNTWIDYTKLSFMALLRHDAPLTFRLFLKRSGSGVPIGNLIKIIAHGSKEFLKIAVEHGADIDEITEKNKKMILVNGDEEMFNLIEQLSMKKKADAVTEFKSDV